MPGQIINILSAEEIRRTLNRLASQVVEKAGDLSQVVLLGIYTRGVPLGYYLAQQIRLIERNIPLVFEFYRV